MPELTIHLSEEAHTIIRSTADQQGRTVGELVEESLERAGFLPSRDDVTAWVREARDGSPLSDEAALELAVAETRAHRQERSERTPHRATP